jgi:hypothetical protein
LFGLANLASCGETKRISQPILTPKRAPGPIAIGALRAASVAAFNTNRINRRRTCVVSIDKNAAAFGRRRERNLKKDLNCSGGATDDDRLEGHAEFQN